MTTCAPDRPVACAHRRRAILEGTFAYDFARRGWFWRDCRTPGQPWARCPWCDGQLPPPEEVERRIIDGVTSAPSEWEPDAEC